MGRKWHLFSTSALRLLYVNQALLFCDKQHKTTETETKAPKQSVKRLIGASTSPRICQSNLQAHCRGRIYRGSKVRTAWT